MKLFIENLIFFDLSEERLRKLIEDSNLVNSKKPDFEQQKAIAIESLKFIVSKFKDNLINVFRLDSEEAGQDIEITILRAFLNSN
jgi:hypothetical protein